MDHHGDWKRRVARKKANLPQKYGYDHGSSRYRSPGSVKGRCSVKSQHSNPIRECHIMNPQERCSGLGSDHRPVKELPGYEYDDIQSRASVVNRTYDYNINNDNNKDLITTTGHRYVDPLTVKCTGPSNQPFTGPNPEANPEAKS